MTRTVTLVLLISVLTLTPEPAGAQVHDDWVQVSSGRAHTCGIRTSGRLFCWGWDAEGQLGNGGGAVNRSVPVQVAGGATNWVAVSAGFAHTCALRSTGRLFCWGDNTSHQLGVGNVMDRQAPVAVGGPVTEWRSVGAGVNHTCAVARTRRLYCWGDNGDGQLGDASRPTESPYPVQVAGNATNWASVSGSLGQTCAVRTTGRLFCWGLDDRGQVGDGGENANRVVPARIGGTDDWTSVSTGWNHTCARRSVGRLYCWGADGTGQLGDGGPGMVEQHRPVEVFGGVTSWRSVSVGTVHTCARRADGRLFCWGWDGDGELGDGTPNNNESAPVEVAGGITTWAAVDSGGDHTCARRTSGRAFCWGDDVSGQLGDGMPLADHASPVVVG